MLIGAGVCLVLAAYFWARRGTFRGVLVALGAGSTPLHDFAYFFYPTGRSVLAGEPVPEGFLYSPAAALSFAPFGLLPYGVAAGVWLLIQALLVAYLAREAVRCVPARRGHALGAIALTLTSIPVLHNLRFGQVSTLVVVLVLGCSVLYQRGRVAPAALCLAGAACFKLYPALFVGYFAFKRDARATIWSLALLVALGLGAPAVIMGWDETLAFYREVSGRLSELIGSGVRDSNSQSLESVLRRAGLGSAWSAGVVSVRVGAWVGILLVLYHLARAGYDSYDAALWVLLATPFIATTSWPHYFAYLPLVYCAAIGGLPRAERPCHRRVAIAAVLVGVVLSNVVFFDVLDSRAAYLRWGLLFVANLCAVVAFALTRLPRRASDAERLAGGAAA